MTFINVEITLHNTHGLPFVYNRELHRLHGNLKFIYNLYISCHKNRVYTIITNKIKLCPLGGCRRLICFCVSVSSGTSFTQLLELEGFHVVYMYLCISIGRLGLINIYKSSSCGDQLKEFIVSLIGLHL